MANTLTDPDWAIRVQIYTFFIEHAYAPTVEDIAALHHHAPDAVRASFRRLHDGHAIFLDPHTDGIRIANPLSAVPTQFRVRVGERTYWANCAWDSLGIPAMLQKDATIEARIPYQDDVVNYAVRNGQLEAPDAFMHFALPARHWYDDLIYT